MQSAPEKVTYSIQRADYECTPDSAPVSLAEALSVLHGHDWEAELRYETELEKVGKERPCPPSIYFNTDTKHLLHICPQRNGMATCYYMNLDNSSNGSWLRDNVPGGDQDRLLELLFRGDYTNLVQGFDPPPDMTCRILRADNTYTSDSGAVTLDKAQSLLRGYDWKAELDYCTELGRAGKESCAPLIGFTSKTGSYLDILPCDGGAARCFFWDQSKQRGWGGRGLSPEEQCRIVEFLYQGDYRSLTQGWDEFEVEATPDELGQVLWTMKATTRRDEWLTSIREVRARRGQPAELTEAERNLSEDDAYALYRGEAELENEERHREETIKALRSSRKWLLTVAAGGTLLAALLYSGVLQAWLSEQLIKDLWAWSVMMMAGGFAMGCLQHLELRALLLGTERARKQANFAKVFCGTAVFLGFAVSIALALTFFLTLLAPWLTDRLSPDHAGLLAMIKNERGFLGVSGALLIVMALMTGAVFAWRRASKPTEPRLTSISVAGGTSVGLFATFAFGPLILMFPVLAAALSLMAFGFTRAETWVHSNFAFLTVLMLLVMAILIAAAYFFGRRRAPAWQDGTSTLINAAMAVAFVYLVGSFGVLLSSLTVGAVLRANGLLG